MATTHPKFSLPVLKKTKRWYFEYFELDKNGKKTKQHRPTYDINRIKDLAARQIEADKKIILLKSKLGFKTAAIENFDNKTIVEAIDRVVQLKCLDTNKSKTAQNYHDAKRMFLKFVATKRIEHYAITTFDRADAFAYRDFLSGYVNEKGNTYRPKTINNHLTFVNVFFEEMFKREWIKTNPFARITKKKEQDPVNRAFTDTEAALVYAEIKKDPILLLAQTLLYRTAIRPIEIARLRPQYFDFKNGIIKIPGVDTKQNRTTRVINIPHEVNSYLESQIAHIKPDWYIFGANLKPNATKHIGRNTLNQRHQIVLRRLHQLGKLENLQGLCFYSWKDTAAFHYIEAGLDIVSLKELFGHADISTTQKYFKRYGIVNEKTQNIKLGLKPM